MPRATGTGRRAASCPPLAGGAPASAGRSADWDADGRASNRVGDGAMNQDLLLDEYVRGEIGRRAFIRGLVADGVPVRIAAIHAGAFRSRPGVSRAIAAEDDPEQEPDAEPEGGGRDASRS